jgi:CHAD domain-containing protein
VRTGHAAPEPAPARPVAAAGLSGAGPPPTAIATTLAALAARCIEAVRRCRAGDDDDAIHDARVAARRLESALQVWRDALDPRQRRAAARRLRRWRRRMGSTRDLEVMVIALAEEELAAAGAEGAGLARLRLALTKRRDRARRRVAALLTPGRLARLQARLARVAAGADPVPGACDQARRRWTRVAHEAASALAAARDTKDDLALHATRIAVKKHRYASEAFAAGSGGPAGDASASARALQRALGEVHDRAALRDYLRRRARRLRALRNPEQAQALESVAARVEQLRLAAIARFRALPPPAPVAD